MTISGCWPSPSSLLAVQKVSQQAPAGVTSQSRPASPQLRYARKSKEAISLTLPSRPSHQRQIGLLRTTPMTLPHERSFAASLRSSPPPSPSPSPSPIKMRTPLKVSAKQPSAQQPLRRALYSDADASRDMALLTSAEKDLGIFIQLNRRRSDALLRQMEGVHAQIKSLMQALKNADRTDPEKTRTFRRQVNDLHRQARSYTLETGEVHFVETPQQLGIQKTGSLRSKTTAVTSFGKEIAECIRLESVAIRQREAVAPKQQDRKILTASKRKDKATFETGSDSDQAVSDIGYKSQDSRNSRESVSPQESLTPEIQSLNTRAREGQKSKPALYVESPEKHVTWADGHHVVCVSAAENGAIPKQRPVSQVPPRNAHGRRLWTDGVSTTRSLPIRQYAIRVTHHSSGDDSSSIDSRSSDDDR